LALLAAFITLAAAASTFADEALSPNYARFMSAGPYQTPLLKPT
jgi:hypothetical protein